MAISPETLELVKVATPIAMGTLTVSVAFLATVIAYGQAVNARHKLRLDLYDRRLKVYRGVHETFFKAIWSDFKLVEVARFHDETAEATFLFGDDINHYLNTAASKVMRYRLVIDQLSKNKPDGDRDALQAEHDVLTQWFSIQLDDISKLFAPYLTFHEIRQ